MIPAPKKIEAMPRSFLGPYVSFNRPTNIARKPLKNRAREEAPEIAARDQWNSSIKALKKTPYETKVPTPTAWIRKQAATIE